MKDLIPREVIEGKIYLIREHKVMLARDLAVLYGVTTKRLNEQVKRNIKRFPDDFMFQLTMEEALMFQFGTSNSRSQFATLKQCQNIKYLPYAFTEQGVAMLSSVLNSERAMCNCFALLAHILYNIGCLLIGITACAVFNLNLGGLVDRKGVVTLKGGFVTLVGAEVKIGEKANDFSVLDNELKEKRLTDFKGKIKLIASVPSLDTPVCDSEIKRFNDEASKLSKDLVIIFISMDLPFAQKRFCGEFDIDRVKTLSDHRNASFGTNYGVLIKELRLLARAIFLIDKDDNVKYVEYVKEVSMPPNYDAALAAIKKIV